MADIQDFRNRLQQLREVIEARLPEIAQVIAISAKGLAERRIKQRGFGEQYSTNEVPAWFLSGKELNAGGTAFLKTRGVNAGKGKKVDKRTATWKEFRAAQGLQTAFIDLSYSNKMWANMAPVMVQNVGQIVYAYLGATNREAQNKMNWNRDNYGDFIQKALTPEDGRILGEVAVSELVSIVQQFKL